MLLVNYADSSQFGTLYRGLLQIPNIFDVFFITRTDITFFEPFYSAMRKVPIPSKITILNKEFKGVANDVILWVPVEERRKLEKYLSSVSGSAHDILRLGVAFLTRGKIQIL